MMLSAINGETKLRVRSGFDFARFPIAKGETIPVRDDTAHAR
jgi:hypothetical protein